MSDIDRDKWDKRYRAGAYAGTRQGSSLLRDWIGRIPAGRALDVACGAGRNALYLAAQGFDVDAVDISGEALTRGREMQQRLGLRVNWLQRDLDEPLLLENAYQLIVIIHFVDLPLIKRLTAALAPGGFLLCEQHRVTEGDVTGPSSAAYRVRPEDLRAAMVGLHVHALEEVLVPAPDGRSTALARVVAQSA